MNMKEKIFFYFITFTISFVTTWFFTLKEKFINMILHQYRFQHTLQPLRGRSGCWIVVLAIFWRKKTAESGFEQLI